jgi:hypothetical protein
VGGRRTRWGRGRRGEVKGVDQKSVDSRDECNWAALRGDVCVCVCVCVCGSSLPASPFGFDSVFLLLLSRNISKGGGLTRE